jgi:hypothetical protein
MRRKQFSLLCGEKIVHTVVKTAFTALQKKPRNSLKKH